MATISVVMEGLTVLLTLTGLTYSTVRKLRAYVSTNKVIQDYIWDSAASSTEIPGRNVHLSGWGNDSHVRQESPSIKASYECFDGLYNFLRAGSNEERLHFSSHMVIISEDGSKRTEAGCSLTLRSDDKEADAFNHVTDFIYGVRQISEFKEMFYQTSTTVFVVDANVLDDPRAIRSKEDTSEIVSMTAITLELLKEVANVVSDGQYIKVVTGQRPEPQCDVASMAYITARWPGSSSAAVKVVQNTRESLLNAEADIDALIDSVTKCSIRDGIRNIILLGRTGSGKSYTGNWILDRVAPNCKDRFEESASGSLTSFVDYLPRDGSEIRIWDTPGLDDGYNRDLQHIDNIESATLEMGAISAVIMCFASVERIDATTRATIRKYSRIIGRPLASRLIVIINRQPSEVVEDQVKAIQTAFFAEGGIQVQHNQIYDLGENTSSLPLKLMNASTHLMKVCKKEAVKVRYYERLCCGLLELERLQDSDEKEEAKEKLLSLSTRALKKRLEEVQNSSPVMRLTEEQNDGKRFILSKHNVYRANDQTLYVEQHILDLPTSVTSSLRGRVSAILRAMSVPYSGITSVIGRVRHLRLVYPGLPGSVTRDERKGLGVSVRKVHYRLVSVDEALSDDVRDLLHHSLGDKEVSRDVSAFDSTLRSKSGRPKRR